MEGSHVGDSISQKTGATSMIRPVTTNTYTNIFWAVRTCQRTDTALVYGSSYSDENYTEDLLCHDGEYIEYDTEAKVKGKFHMPNPT